MSDIKGSPLLSPKVQANLTNANKQFLNNIRQAMSVIQQGETKTLTAKNHKAYIKKNASSGVITVDVKPEKHGNGQRLSIAARYSEKRSLSLNFSTRTTSQSESLASLDSDGDGHSEVGSFVYDFNTDHAGYEENEMRSAVIHDLNDDGKTDNMELVTQGKLDAVYDDSVVVVRRNTIQTIEDTNADGLLDKA